MNRCVEKATKQRIGEQAVVLLVQDTTELDLSLHPPDDAGCLNAEDRFGLYDHTHLAVTPAKLPLGVVGVEDSIALRKALVRQSNAKSFLSSRRKAFAGSLGIAWHVSCAANVLIRKS